MHADIIPVERLLYALIPALVVVGIQFKWSMDYKNSLLALLRMLVQLLIIGFALSWLFAVDQPLIVLLILSVMLLISSWIALRTISHQRSALFWYALFSIIVGGASTLLVMVLAVLAVDNWITPQYIIPLAGMFFASSMNSISVSAERFQHEIKHHQTAREARNHAFNAGLISITNSLLAVGLVSLPGMMTGQILSGVSPLIAVRYQIAIMALIFAASGISSALFLVFLCRQHDENRSST